MARHDKETNAVRRYLLKQLSDSERETVELRFLSDETFAEELEFVEDELIDEYLAGELSHEERLSFEETFLAHPERQRKLEAGQALKRYLGTLPPPPSPVWAFLDKWIRQPLLSTPIRATVTPLVLAVVGVGIWLAVRPSSDLQKGLLALNEAYRQERPVEARISNLDYAPFITTRGTEPERVNAFERSRAERYLSDAFKERADADSYHGLGKFYLLQKDTSKAIEYLGQASKADPGNAQIYADLGAAYLEKAKQELAGSKPDDSGPTGGSGLEDLGRSLEYLKQALELDPNILEALFNRALVHQYQGLYQQAEADWRAYLEKDSKSQWAVDAQEKLRLLEQKKTLGSQNADPIETFLQAYQVRDDEGAWDIYRRSHGNSGNQITRVLVDDFLSDNARRKQSENLEALNYLGQLEMRKAQDKYTLDLATVYASLTPQTKPLLVQARQQVKNGVELIPKARIGAAIELLAGARNAFEKLGDFPELLATDAAIAYGAAVQPDLARGQEVLARLIPACESRNYKWLLAQSLSRKAHIESNLNNYSEAISDGHRAMHLFQGLDDASNLSGTLVQLGLLHLFLNDTEMSFSYLRRALSIVQSQSLPAVEIWSVQIATSLTLTAIKLYRAALDFQNEALQIALGLPSRSALLISRSYQYIGLTYGSLRQFNLALQNVRLAYDEGKPFANERNGQNMMANASLRLGDLYRASGDPNGALGAYEESSRLYEALEFAHYNYAAHKGKFLSYLALNDDPRAEHELQIVLRLFDDYRDRILGERQKNFFFDREQDIYDLAIDFSYSRIGDQRRAFEYSETCRARNLRELMHHGAKVTQSDSGLDLQASEKTQDEKALPLTLTQIRQQLPEGVQIIQYTVLEKKLLIWHLTRSSFFSQSVNVDSTQLAELVQTALRQIAQRDEKAAAASLKKLYELIIEPVRERLDTSKVLCFVPDKVLHFVPFVALISPSSRYLGQDYQLMTSPSSTVLIESTNRAKARASVKEERLLAVGDPTFDRQANPNLSNLPGARREVERIASNYSRQRILIAGHATPRSIVDEIGRADVAHFAAHYEIDPRSPISSRLLLASQDGDRAHPQRSGLNSGDIYRMNLTRTRLVVLSGCKTGIEQQFGGEGPMGFARSFLVAGVPVVVASLWPVDSDATAELMIAFHRFRTAARLSTTEALMRAQQEMMGRKNYSHPYYWAGFTTIGGYSDF